jgi:hypothetical protein
MTADNNSQEPYYSENKSDCIWDDRDIKVRIDSQRQAAKPARQTIGAAGCGRCDNANPLSPPVNQQICNQ